MITIAFHSNQLGERGTEVALYDYAHFNETLLNNKSVILYRADSSANNPSVVERFRNRFSVIPYNDTREIDDIVTAHHISLFYAIKAGRNDGVVSTRCRTAVHVVFGHHDPHGDVYAYVSEWLSRKMSRNTLPFVPHMVHLPDVKGDMRGELRIPSDATVFGRYGGSMTFNYRPGIKAVVDTAQKRRDLYFLFVNTDSFCDPLPNIIHLPTIIDPTEKSRFINTCDAMVLARKEGETFGLAVGEFSIKNKPVIANRFCRDKAHIEALGQKGTYYWTSGQLRRYLMSFKPHPEKNWDAYSDRFNPEAVMKRFAEVFIRGI